MDADKFKSVAINIKTYRLLEELAQKKFELPISMAKTVSSLLKDTKSSKQMQIEKLSKTQSNSENKSDEYGPFNKRCKQLQIYGPYLWKKIRPHQVA